MGIAIVTGSGGLIGSESVRFFAEQGMDVIGVENDMRAHFFGDVASTTPTSEQLLREVEGFHWERLDIRDADGLDALFQSHGRDIELVVQTAAQPSQPSHDWAATDPHTDFTVNANGHPEPAGGDSPPRARRDLHLHLHEQGIRRPSQLPTPGGASPAAGAAPGASLV